MLLIAQYAVAWTMPAILRLLWRGFHPVPLRRDDVPAWQYRGAQIVHAALYLLLVILPLMGWANASARGWTAHFIGLFLLPRITGSAANEVEAVVMPQMAISVILTTSLIGDRLIGPG